MLSIGVSGGGSGNANLVGSSITPLPNGWYRLTATSLGVGPYNSGFGVGMYGGGNRSYTGDGTSGVYVWGLQIENAPFPTSYIPTTSATVTRTTDYASITGTNFSSWYNQSQGTFILNSKLLPGSGSQFGTAAETFINGSGIANGLSIMPNYINSGAAVIEVPLNGDYSGRGIFSNSLNYSNEVKMAAAIQDNNVGLSVNGVSYNSITNKTIAQDVTAMIIGASRTSSNILYGTISRISYYPTRLSNAQLQAITA